MITTIPCIRSSNSLVYSSRDTATARCRLSKHIFKQHKANIHGIDVKWFKCDQCEYKCKSNGNLKKHKAHKHGIDAKWFNCDQRNYKCKRNFDLKKHKDRRH